MRKRYYILLVSRDGEGELRKIPIPLHYVYVFLTGAIIGMLTITGIAGSYTRMLMKVSHFNELRSEKDALTSRYNKLEQVAQEKEIQAASLGSLAGEVSALYGLRSDARLVIASDRLDEQQYASSLDQLSALRNTALNGTAAIALEYGPRNGGMTTSDWLRLAAAPNLWPVDGHITGSFGERIDPFNGEGAFHTGIDIATNYGSPVIAPADGVVVFAGMESGYGRMVVINHTQGVTTRFAHLSAFTVVSGEQVHRGETIAYVGDSGRSTGPHLHYEVRINDTPVNPYKYLRQTFSQSFVRASGGSAAHSGSPAGN